MDTSSNEVPSPLPLAEEEHLVKRAQAGDSDSMALLYRAYVQAVYRFLYLRLSNSLVAEDITADVFLRAVDGLPRYSHRGLPFGAWLFRIARDRLIDYYRQSARRPTMELEDSLASNSPDPHDMAELVDATEFLHDALKRLTDEQRDVIQFRFIEDWSLEQTARAMNKSVNAIKALQHRALNALSRYLKDSGLDQTVGKR